MRYLLPLLLLVGCATQPAKVVTQTPPLPNATVITPYRGTITNLLFWGTYTNTILPYYGNLTNSYESIKLMWEYGEQSNIVFVVRELKTNQVAEPSYDWPIKWITTNKFSTIPIDLNAQCVWFTVTASNTFNGLESPFATK